MVICSDRSGVPEAGVPISGPAGLAIITGALRVGSSNLRESDYCGFADTAFGADGATLSGYFRRSGVNMSVLRMTGGSDPHTLLGNVKS